MYAKQRIITTQVIVMIPKLAMTKYVNEIITTWALNVLQ